MNEGRRDRFGLIVSEVSIHHFREHVAGQSHLPHSQEWREGLPEAQRGSVTYLSFTDSLIWTDTPVVPSMDSDLHGESIPEVPPHHTPCLSLYSLPFPPLPLNPTEGPTQFRHALAVSFHPSSQGYSRSRGTGSPGLSLLLSWVLANTTLCF